MISLCGSMYNLTSIVGSPPAHFAFHAVMDKLAPVSKVDRPAMGMAPSAVTVHHAHAACNPNFGLITLLVALAAYRVPALLPFH
jgi:hypothetical protein